MLLFRDLNHNYNLSFDVILYEQEETSIYNSANLDSVIGTIGQRIFGQYRVIDYRKIDGKDYYLLTNKQGIIGWTHLNESITLYNKAHEPVKVIEKNFKKNEINTILRLNLESFDINKVYMSKKFILLNGEVLEAIYLKNTLIGFFDPNDLDHSIKINDRIDLIKAEELYLDSGFLIKAEDINKESKVNIVDYFPILKIARLKCKNTILWAEIIDFEHEKLNKENKLLSELSYSNLFAIHLVNSYESEREKSKNIIINLMNENKALLETLEKKEKPKNNCSYENKNYKQLYQNLRLSKLGKIQTAYWRYRNRRRRNKK